MLEKRLEEILTKIKKPASYTGNEWNVVKKDWEKTEIKIALVFPDLYEIGMSHLGMRIIYHILNNQEDVVAERVFSLGIDLEEILRERNLPIFSLESKKPLNNFDLIGFSLTYELSYTNILNIFELANIPKFAKERKELFPLIFAGGPCTHNPEPIADFFDFFVLGEGEEVILKIVELVRAFKNKGSGIKKDFLKELSKVKGVYVPSLYEVFYQKDGTIKEIKIKEDGIPLVIQKRIVSDLNSACFPTAPIVPYVDVVHDRINLEVFRGCRGKCRFCNAYSIYFPLRRRELFNLKKLADLTIKRTGYEEISLLSLNTSDYPDLEELISYLISTYSEKGISISLPSLRPEKFSKEFIEQIRRIKKTGLTFAPEAGSERLRKIINKPLTEEEILQTIHLAFSLGWTHLKLYFMIGLPFEKDEDISAIVFLVQKILKTAKASFCSSSQRKAIKRIAITISTFVPKAHTPFQWEEQAEISEIEKKQNYLRANLKSKKIELKFTPLNLSFLEGILSRGDRKLSKVIYKAQKLGCKFDAWRESFNWTLWQKALLEENIAPEFYLYRERSYDEILPWEHLNCGINKEILIKESERAKNEK